MKEKIEKLLNILKEELKLYSTLLNLSSEEQKIIIKGDVRKLEENLREKEELLISLKKVEGEKENLREEISQNLGIEKKDLTLTKIIEFSEEYSSEFKDLQEKFLNVLKDLEKIQNVNRELLENSLSIIDFSLRLFTGGESLPLYNERGEDKTTFRGEFSILNQKV
jgi:flagellar biosynthesis/type III secretory pathway chaperone